MENMAGYHGEDEARGTWSLAAGQGPTETHHSHSLLQH